MPNKVCRCEDRHVLQMENHITRMKEKNPILVLGASQSTLFITHICLREALWGSEVGCDDLAGVTLQLQVLVPCSEICPEHKELQEDPGAKAESATGVGDGKLKGVWCLERKRRLQMTEMLEMLLFDFFKYLEKMGLIPWEKRGPQGLTGASICTENLTWVGPGCWEDRSKACFGTWHLPASHPVILLPLKQPEAWGRPAAHPRLCSRISQDA